MINPVTVALMAAVSLAAPANAQQIDLVGELFKALTKPKAKTAAAAAPGGTVAQGYATPADGLDEEPEDMKYEPLEAVTPLTASFAGLPKDPDIAGLKIGMSIRDARKALKAAGFKRVKCRNFYLNCNGPSFRSDVNVEKDRLLGNIGTYTADGIVAIEALGPTGGRVRADFIMWPTGPRIRLVRFFYPNRGDQTFEELIAPAIAKYGKPVRQDQDSAAWQRDCRAVPNQFCITAGASGDFKLFLERNDDQMKKYDKLVQETARRELPARAAPTY